MNKLWLVLGVLIMINSCANIKSKQIEKNNVAIILIDFPDIPDSLRNQMLTVKEAEEFFVGDIVKDYFDTMSYGNFEITGKCFGYYTMPDSLKLENRNSDYIIKTTENYSLIIPDFNSEDFDTVAFIIFHHEYVQQGLSAAGFANYTMNGKKYSKKNVMYVGALLSEELKSNDTFGKLASTRFRYGNKEDEFEEKPHPCGFKYLQTIFIHEFIHQILGYRNILHSNSTTNDTLYDYEEPTIFQPPEFMDKEYGNGFDIMGGAAMSLSLNAGYRKLCGWLTNENSYVFDKKGEYSVTLFPINRRNVKAVVEIKLTNKEKKEENYPGYFIEIREPDRWDSSLKSQNLINNTMGLMVNKFDGFKANLLCMNPSKNFILDDEIFFVNYSDMCLRDNQIYENDDIKIYKVKHNNDNSITFNIILK